MLMACERICHQHIIAMHGLCCSMTSSVHGDAVQTMLMSPNAPATIQCGHARRSKVRVLVRDVAATRAGFGPYVDPVSVDMGSAAGLARALKGVRCVVALGQLRGLLPACKKAGVQRVVLLSTAGG